jgi:hypothetical protein
MGYVAARVMRPVNIIISGQRSQDIVAALTQRAPEATAITART